MTAALGDRLRIQGPDALRDEELLALVLGGLGPRHDPLEVASKLIEKFRDLPGLARAAVPELEAVEGIGPANALRVRSALRLAQRLGVRPLNRGEPIRSARDVAARYGAGLVHRRREHFVILALDVRHRVIAEHVISIGSATASLVHPRETFEPLIREGASGAILLHCHPSADPTPSAEDISITKRLREAGELLGIRIVDHVILGRQGYVSLADRGWTLRPTMSRAADGAAATREAS